MTCSPSWPVTSRVSCGETRSNRTARAPRIARPGSAARATAGRAGCAVSGMPRWRTAADLWRAARSAKPTARPNGRRPWRCWRGIAPERRRVTLAADEGYDVAGFAGRLRDDKVAPRIAVQGRRTKIGKRRKTLIDGRATRHPGHAASQRCRQRIEEAFGRAKTQGGHARTRFRGRRRVDAPSAWLQPGAGRLQPRPTAPAVRTRRPMCRPGNGAPTGHGRTIQTPARAPTDPAPAAPARITATPPRNANRRPPRHRSRPSNRRPSPTDRP